MIVYAHVICTAPGVLFAAIPVFVGCKSATCSKFEENQKVFSGLLGDILGLLFVGWHLCNMSAAFAIEEGGQDVETTDLVVLRKVVSAGEMVSVPRSSGFMIALFVP